MDKKVLNKKELKEIKKLTREQISKKLIKMAAEINILSVELASRSSNGLEAHVKSCLNVMATVGACLTTFVNAHIELENQKQTGSDRKRG